MVAFRGDDLVVGGTQSHAQVAPGIKLDYCQLHVSWTLDLLQLAYVVLHSDGSRSAVVLANRPVLGEGGGTLDGGRVRTSGGVNVVRRTIRLNSALLGSLTARVVGLKHQT